MKLPFFKFCQYNKEVSIIIFHNFLYYICYMNDVWTIDYVIDVIDKLNKQYGKEQASYYIIPYFEKHDIIDYSNKDIVKLNVFNDHHCV